MRSLNHIVALIFLLSMGSQAFAQFNEGGLPRTEKSEISKLISIYPNPATDYISIKLGLLNVNHAKLTLHNILGSELAVEVEVIDEHEARIRVKDLPTGYYFLAIHDEQSQFKGSYKFLKRQ